MKKNKLLLLLIVCLAVVSVFAACKKRDSETEPMTEPPTETTEEITEPPTDPSDNVNYNPLTGLCDAPENAKYSRPIAIVMSNAPKARPQWGINSPDIMIEGLVEGGITRMLGLFTTEADIPKYGPVRSARHDFIEIAQGFDAVFVHAGESIYATRHFANYGIDDIDGCEYDGTYFRRDSERRQRGLEHSMYIDAEYLLKTMDYQDTRTDIDQNYVNVLKFAKPEELTIPTAGSCIQADFEYSNSFKNKMVYDEATQLYTKYQDDEVMTDANTDENVTYVNVILLYTEVGSMGDSSGCIDMDLTGGSGVYISKGQYENITWSKGDATSQLKLTRADGSVLPLNPGNSYIGLVPANRAGNTVITPATTTAQ